MNPVPRTLADKKILWQARAPQATPDSIRRLLDTLDQHDPYTHGHSERVGAYSTLIARLMGFDADAVEVVRRAALVHDIGKGEIPLEVLCKTGPLTDDEFELIKRHPIFGSSMLEDADLKALVPMVLHHHERWDGRGYPTGLAGIDIPVESRIILVADAFDAMTTNRPYGEVHTKASAIEEIRTCAGKQFDPLVANAMSFAYKSALLEEESLRALEQGAELSEILPAQSFVPASR